MQIFYKLQYIEKMNLWVLEIPDVEAMRRFLEAKLLKPEPKKLQSANFGLQNEGNLDTQILKGQHFCQVSRYGRALIFKLETHSLIMSYRRKVGRYSYHSSRPQLGEDDNIEFEMSDGSCLLGSKLTQFKGLQIFPRGQEKHASVLSQFGLEVNSPLCNAEYLQHILKTNTKKPIKEVLLDQKIIVGIGNAFANEILFAAKVNPFKLGKHLPFQELQRIVETARNIIEKSCQKSEAWEHINESLTIKYDFKVYGQSKCSDCGVQLTKKAIYYTKAFYCGRCQPYKAKRYDDVDW